MSNDKAIESGKEHCKKYRGSKAIDKTCRCHGGCVYCENNRLHNTKVKEKMAEDKINEYLKESKDENS